MIIVKLIGGLGNQMFQYATARRLALVNQTILKLDISGYAQQKVTSSREGFRSYHLGYFTIQEEIASPEEIRYLTVAVQSRLKRMMNKILRLTGLIPHYSIVTERKSIFNPQILDLHGNVYLEGYWQSWKYFSDIHEVLHSEFVPRQALSSPSLEVAEVIGNTMSVGIHIRRGDYIFDPKTRLFHGECNLDYYRKCVRLLQEKVGNLHLFIFSDEPDWVQDNFKTEHPMTIVNHNGPDRDYEDLYLLSLCKNLIIANSSFSW
jgi:hypothetical protein